MIKKLLFLFFLSLAFTATTFCEDIFQLTFAVRTSVSTDTFPALLQNKNWNSKSAFVLNMTSNSNYGKSLTSGQRKGWTIFLQPNGAWGWNIGDSKERLDYLPSERQRINDGQWHKITCVYDLEKKTVRFYFDKKEVAIYNYKNIAIEAAQIKEGLSLQPIPGIELKKLKLQDKWKPKFKLKSAPETLKVVSWNIWHGGRRNGIEEGLRQTIGTLRAQRADLIFLQETYGSGPIIADSLGMYFFLISSNLSILSKYPFSELFTPWEDFRFGGAMLQLSRKQKIGVFDVWLNYLPNTDKMMKEGAGYGDLLAAEMKLRGREILNLFRSFKTLNLDCPLIFGGDFNSGSHLDWTLENSALHGGYFLPWPVSKAMYREGFVDAYHRAHPDYRQSPGHTWSPRFKDQLQYRIDYIYADQDNWKVLDAGVEGYENTNWSSDHALVWTVLRLGNQQ